MDYSKISNTIVRSALEAWQSGDCRQFASYFSTNATVTDDGTPKDFHHFIKESCGKEKYLDIDLVENEGKDIYGKFDTGSWGVLRVYFKFQLNADGKFSRLDIGQAVR